MSAQQIIIVLAIGLVAGWLASLVVGGGGLIRYIIWGLLGSVVAGLVLPAIEVSITIGNPLITQIVTAAIGAIILVVIGRALFWAQVEGRRLSSRGPQSAWYTGHRGGRRRDSSR